MATPLTDEEHIQIREAIRAAEEKTDGEIYCVMAGSSDRYFFPAAFIATMLLLPFSLAAAWLLEYQWLSVRLPLFVAGQVLALGGVLAMLWFWPALRLLLVPRGMQFRAAHDNARKQFLARNVHLTARRTGVLIFVSLAERYAEVLADSGINAKVDQHIWDGVVGGLVRHARRDKLADGYVQAVRTVGTLLAEHFPVTPGDVNELDDHLVEI